MNNTDTNITLEQLLAIRRDQYLEARMDYELALREFSLVNVNKCPDCFEYFYEDKKSEMEASYLSGQIRPNCIEVLELMAQTQVIFDAPETPEVSISNSHIH
jgi:hypothetical protein